MLYNFMKARSIKNKLEVKEGTLFSIDEVELLKEGFKIHAHEICGCFNGDIYYSDRQAFDKEWKLLSWNEVFNFKDSGIYTKDLDKNWNRILQRVNEDLMRRED